MIAACLGSFLRACWLIFLFVQPLATVTTFSIHFLLVREGVHALTFDSWPRISFIILDSSCLQSRMGPGRSLVVSIFLVCLHRLQCIHRRRTTWNEWLCRCIVWLGRRLASLMRAQIEVVDYVRYIGHSSRIFLLGQFICKVLASCWGRLVLIRESLRSDLSTWVGLAGLRRFSLLIDDWVVGSVDLESVRIVWGLWEFDVFTFNWNFWRLLSDVLLGIFSCPWVD